MKVRLFRSSFGPSFFRWGVEVRCRGLELHVTPLSWQRWQWYVFTIGDARPHDISGWCARLGPFSLEREPIRLWRVEKAWTVSVR